MKGTLTVTQRPLTITAGGGSKIYDGTALTKSEGAILNYSYWTENIGGVWTAAPAAARGTTADTAPA